MKNQLYIILCILQTAHQLQGMSLFRTDTENLLHYAETGNYQKVEELLKKGIDPNVAVTEKSKNWKKSLLTPLMLAAKYNHPKIVDLLVAYKADVTLANDMGATALHLAARQNNAEIIKQLIAYGASVDARTNVGWLNMTSLMLAAANDHVEAAQELLKHGACIALTCDKEKSTSPLSIALRNNHKNMIEFLIQKGALANHSEDETPLFIAVLKNNLKIAEILLRNGAEINRGIEKETPLTFATQKGFVAMVELLLAYGADAAIMVHRKDCNGYFTALQLANRNHHTHLIKLLTGYENKQKASAHQKEIAAAQQEAAEKMAQAQAHKAEKQTFAVTMPSAPEEAPPSYESLYSTEEEQKEGAPYRKPTNAVSSPAPTNKRFGARPGCGDSVGTSLA